ncbi:MAG: hypothetical protein IKD21_02540 [Clostridia bacterium]|nr:hypothetical protein [Clostridia bacterium]
MEKTKISIKRLPCVLGCAAKCKIELDGICVGKVANGKTVEFLVEQGKHTLSIYWGWKKKTTIEININEDDEIINLIAKLNIAKDRLDFYSADNQLLSADSDKGSTVTMSNPKGTTNFARRDVVVLASAAVVVCLCVVGILLAGNTMVSENNNVVNTQNENMTEEEKAGLEIEKANNCFAENDYQEAMEICSTVVETYPNTSIAQNMNSYLQEQFGQFVHITAKELMNEYETNVVNADEKYTGTVVIISGTVSGIDKTNNDKNLCVLLKSGTYFANVQLNFDTSQTESVATLKPGDTVKAIGRCTGKNGKVLVFFDGNNVMISDSLLID